MNYEKNPENHEIVMMKRMTLNCAETNMMAGRKYMDMLLDTLTDDEMKVVEKSKEKRMFRFVNGVRFPSKSELKVPDKLGEIKCELNVSVIDAHIPLLVGIPDRKKMGLTVNFEKDKAYTSTSQKVFNVHEEQMEWPCKNNW